MYYEYTWYHHMMSKEEKEKIENCFKNRDYFTFVKIYQQYNAKGLLSGFYSEELETFCPIIYFPDYICGYETEKSIRPKEYINILEKENFFKIDFIECECG